MIKIRSLLEQIQVDQISEVSYYFYLKILIKIQAEYIPADRNITDTTIANIAANVFSYSNK